MMRRTVKTPAAGGPGNAASIGETGSQGIGVEVEIGDAAKAAWGEITGTRKPHHEGYSKHDQKWNARGAEFADIFDTWFDIDCRKFVDRFISGKKKLSDYFPDYFEDPPAPPEVPQPNPDPFGVNQRDKFWGPSLGF